MINLREIPKQPTEALKTLAIHLRDALPVEGKVPTTAWLGHRANGRDLKLLFKATEISARRCSSESLRSEAAALIPVQEGDSLNDTRKKLDQLLDAIYVEEFDDHFIDEEATIEFDRADLSGEDKAKIRDLLATARRLTENADFLSEDHKKRVIYRISDVENELFKEVAGYKAFLAAAAETIGLVKKFGEDAKPLAEAIEQARTVTERRVEGYQKIEAQEKPKQLPKPSEETVD